MANPVAVVPFPAAPAEAVVILPAGLVDRVLDVLAPVMRGAQTGRVVSDHDVLAAVLLEGLVRLTTDARAPHRKRASAAIVSYALIYPRA
jgi:hypothetical protein